MVGPSVNPATTTTTTTTTTTVKFLCSYGGKIIPRYPDGKLRYLGGETRVLAVDRSVSFSELLLKLRELCGKSVILRCQLPTEDLDALVSITSDEDLANLIEEYDRSSSSSLKIRTFLSPPKSAKKISPLSSSASSSSSSSSSSLKSTPSAVFTTTVQPQLANHYYRNISTPATVPRHLPKPPRKAPNCAYRPHRIPSHVYLIHNGNHWQ